MTRSAAVALALAALSGLLRTLVFPQASLAWLAPVCLVPLLVVLWGATPRRRFLLGWVSGGVFWAGTCYWIYPVMRDYAGITPPAAAALYVAFFAAKGLHAAAFAYLAGPLLDSRAATRSAAALWVSPLWIAALWVAIEGTHQYLGFTWTLLGNAAVDFPLPQIARLAPWTGVYGPSFVFAALNAALAIALIARSARPLVCLSLLPGLLLLPALPEAATGSRTARLIQPNVRPDEMKSAWSARRGTQHLARMLELSTNYKPEERPSLLVWPEYSAPAYYFDNPDSRAFMERVARESGAYFIFNSISFKDGDTLSPQNSSVTLDPQGRLLSRYSKMRLVPFGEFVPWPFSYFVDKITLQAGSFKPGETISVARVEGRGVSTFICYESVFARSIRRFTAAGAELLVNISNDSWYGRSAARFQHLQIVRMRAIENGRWILRATNDGITTAIDPAGRLAEPLPYYRQGALTVRFNYESARTGYVRWGEWFWWLTAAAAAASCLSTRSRARQQAVIGGPSID